MINKLAHHVCINSKEASLPEWLTVQHHQHQTLTSRMDLSITPVSYLKVPFIDEWGTPIKWIKCCRLPSYEFASDSYLCLLDTHP